MGYGIVLIDCSTLIYNCVCVCIRICGIWKFPGQGLNPSHSCDLCCSCSNARYFNPLHWAGDQTSASIATQATAVGFLLHGATAGTPSGHILRIKVDFVPFLLLSYVQIGDGLLFFFFSFPFLSLPFPSFLLSSFLPHSLPLFLFFLLFTILFWLVLLYNLLVISCQPLLFYQQLYMCHLASNTA